MSGLKVYESLIGHPKILKAARISGEDKFAVAGLMLFVWLWALSRAEDGRIPAEDFPSLVKELGWEKDPEVLLEALLTCGRNGSGLLERDKTDLLIHDWEEYTGALIASRRSERERARRNRERKQQAHAYRTRTLREASNVKRREEQSRYKPLSASGDAARGEVVDLCGRHAVDPPPSRNCDGDKDGGERRPDKDAAVYFTKRRRKLQGRQLAWFDEFWEAFAYRKSKAEAADAWLDLEVTKDMSTSILAGARREAAARPALLEKGRTPKYAQGWLSGRRWEDEGDDSGDRGFVFERREPTEDDLKILTTRDDEDFDGAEEETVGL